MNNFAKVAYSVSALLAISFPFHAQAADGGSNFSVGIGSSSFSNLKFSGRGQAFALKKITTFQQSVGLSHRLFDSDSISLDAIGELIHGSGDTANYSVAGNAGNGTARFDRTAAYADLKLAYNAFPIIPYAGVGLGGVQDRVSLPEAPAYKANYLAGKAFVGAEWHARNGFGINVRASSVKRVD